jgi:aryl-alcohol dehydrogenase-like predicted oxidoreductase
MNRNELKKRFIIGTANFTQKYGADPTKVSPKEISKILNFATEHGVNKIDTASAYLKNKNIFTNIKKKFQFTSKITPNFKWVSLEFCQNKINEHFKILNTNQVETLLFHDTKILFSKFGFKIFKNLEILKKKKYFKKIGISIYDTNYLNYLTSKYNFDLIQCPYNVLDKRILTSGWFDKLKKKNIQIQIRSIFLQGLLVNKKIYKKKYFKKWRNFFLEWFDYLDNKNISPIDYCLTDIMNYDFDQIIIGINNYNNLNEIVNFNKIKKDNKLIDFKTNDIAIIDPRNWK